MGAPGGTSHRGGKLGEQPQCVVDSLVSEAAFLWEAKVGWTGFECLRDPDGGRDRSKLVPDCGLWPNRAHTGGAEECGLYLEVEIPFVIG